MKSDQRTSYSLMLLLPMKCYLLSEIKKYNSLDSYDVFYEVFFPYLNSLNGFKEPYFSIDRKCLNTDFVNNIYDTYEDAREQAILNNKLLVARQLEKYENYFCEDRIREIKQQLHEDKKYYRRRIRKLMKEE